MDGLTLLSELGGLNSPIMSIIISAYGDLDNIRRAMNLGAFDFLTKPINFSDLDVTLEKSFQFITQMQIAQKEHEILLGLQQALEIARQIQQSLIPTIDNDFLKTKGLSVGTALIPAQEVGGDFFDFFFLDDDTAGFCIADVAGKGVPAALFMTMTKTLLKASAMSGMSAGECLDYVNRFLSQDNDTCMFVTIFFAVLNLNTGELKYANGGHNPPYIIPSGGKVCPLERANGIALGLQQCDFEEKTIQCSPGDTLYLYTDGVTEAMNEKGELFLNSRLEEELKASCSKTPDELCKDILSAVERFVSGAPQSDDITMMTLRFRG